MNCGVPVCLYRPATPVLAPVHHDVGKGALRFKARKDVQGGLRCPVPSPLCVTAPLEDPCHRCSVVCDG